MDHRTLGSSGLQVSRVGFGCSRIGGSVSGGDASGASRILNRVFDAGINFFDTANIYGQGRSEQLLAGVFAGRRDQVVLATKGGYQFSAAAGWLSRLKPLARRLIKLRPNLARSVQRVRASQLSQSFSSEALTQSLEGSLRRLRTDYIDLYQLHSPPLDVIQSGEVFTTLDAMKKAGKIRSYGVACLEPLHSLACLEQGVPAVQIELNFVRLEGLAQVIPRTAAAGVGVIARQPFAAGTLHKEPDALTAEAFAGDPVAAERGRRTLSRLSEFGPLPEIALRYLRQREGIDVLLFGTTRLEHLERNLAALERPPLTSDELAGIEAILQEGSPSSVH